MPSLNDLSLSVLDANGNTLAIGIVGKQMYRDGITVRLKRPYEMSVSRAGRASQAIFHLAGQRTWAKAIASVPCGRGVWIDSKSLSAGDTITWNHINFTSSNLAHILDQTDEA